MNHIYSLALLFIASSVFAMDDLQKFEEKLKQQKEEKISIENSKYIQTLNDSRKKLRSTRQSVQAVSATAAPLASSAQPSAPTQAQNILVTEPITPIPAISLAATQHPARLLVDLPTPLPSPETIRFKLKLEKGYQHKKLNPQYIIAAIMGAWACTETITTLKNIPKEEWDNTPYVKRPLLITAKTIQAMMNRPGQLARWVNSKISARS